MKDVRLAVGVPNGGSVHVDTVRGLISLVGELGSHVPLNFLFHGGCYVHRNRETIVKQALELDYTHLMFIDTDMLWSPGAVQRLLEQKKPVIGAAYNERRFPLQSTLKMADKKGNVISVKQEDWPKKTFKCHAIATGFMLIDLSIMKDIPKPWFFFDTTEEGEFHMGEDIWFCEKVREAGFSIYCDPTIEVAHIGNYLY